MAFLTELEQVWHRTSSREMLVILDSFPNVPATQIVDNLAFWILHLVPLQERNTRLVHETRYVEDLPEGDRCGVTANVRGREHCDDRDTIREYAQVYEVGIRHDIVR